VSTPTDFLSGPWKRDLETVHSAHGLHRGESRRLAKVAIIAAGAILKFA